MAGIINNNQNLQNDLAVFDYTVETGDWGAFGGYVGAAYDSSADYWKLKMYADGSHEILFDGKKELSIDYINEKGEVISTSVPEKQDMSDVGMAGSLGKILGIERVDELLGSSYLNADNYDFNTLKDVLKLSDNQIAKIQRTGSLDGIELTESQKYSLVGEAIIKNSGASWNGSSWINTEGISLTITDKAYNGNIMAEVQNGKYLYSTVSATLFRDPDSWNSIVGTPDKDDPSKIIWENYDDYSNLDVRVFTKTGINWDFNESYVDVGIQSIDNMFQSISNPEKSSEYNQAYYDKNTQKWVQGNTIMSEYYNMQYYSTSGSYEGAVLVKNNACKYG